MARLPRGLARLAFTLLLGALGLLLRAQSGPVPGEGLGGKRVLVLTSYGDGRPGVDVLLRGFMTALEGAGISVDQVYTEHLDLERAQDEAFTRSLAQTLRLKYAPRPIDLVYILEQPAMDFFLRNLADVTPGAPVLLARAVLPQGVDGGKHRFVRQLITYDLEGTLHRALELFPETRRVLFVAGHAESDRAMAAQAARVLGHWRGDLASEDTTELTFDQMKARVARRAPGTIILVLPFNRDAEGRTAVQMEVAFLVAATAGTPVFTLWENAVGRGAVGGSVTNFGDIGHQAGEFSINLMTGRTVLATPVTDLPARSFPKFDWAQIERWHGAAARLPKESTFLNRPATLWEQYRRTVIGTTLFLLAQTLLIALLLLERRRRNLAQQHLRESEQEFRWLAETVPQIVWITRADGWNIFFNQQWVDYTGLSLEESYGHGWSTPCHPEDRPRAEAAWQHATATGTMYSLECRLRRADGVYRSFLISGLPKRNEAGEILEWFGTCTDIEAIKQAEKEQSQLQAQLHQSQKLEGLGSLAGGVAHDINNVLGAILGLASAHRSRVDPSDPMARALDTITSACLRGRGVVKSLLYFARKDLDLMGPVDLNALVLEMVDLLRSTTLKRIQVTTELQETLPALVGDAGALSHALVNLCVNAVDAMPGGGELRIRTRRRPEGAIELSVKDTGEGMSPEVARRAMEPFYSTKPQGRGTGLGLSMVYGTVQAHGGSLELRSSPGEGTEVLMILPAAPTEPGLPAEAPPQGPGALLGPLRILLVDDDELVRESMTPMLEMLGHQVQAASCGQEAIDHFRAGRPADLVILDMNMPGLTGAQTLPRLLELRPGQAVLMASGYSDTGLGSLLADNPSVASIRKPFSLQELQEKLAAMAAQADSGGRA